MRTFFDSSAFAKRYLEELGSESVDALCVAATDLALAVICVPEIISALNRRVREGALSRPQYAVAKQHLAEDVRDASIVELTPAVIASATTVLEGSPLRAMDALHVACALQWGAEIFVSSDTRQIAAAEKVGLCTRCAWSGSLGVPSLRDGSTNMSNAASHGRTSVAISANITRSPNPSCRRPLIRAPDSPRHMATSVTPAVRRLHSSSMALPSATRRNRFVLGPDYTDHSPNHSSRLTPACRRTRCRRSTRISVR